MPNFNTEPFFKQSLEETKMFFKEIDKACQNKGYINFEHLVNAEKAKRLLLNENTEL